MLMGDLGHQQGAEQEEEPPKPWEAGCARFSNRFHPGAVGLQGRGKRGASWWGEVVPDTLNAVSSTA